MQIAEVLSDLTSLRACGPNEALAFVNVHKSVDAQSDSQQDAKNQEPGNHEDLSRAEELVELHYGVKVKHMGSAPNFEPGIDEDLRVAREAVNRVLREVDDA